MDNLARLTEAGVSIWLDDFSRSRLENGDLKNKIGSEHVVGVTTNPSIFSHSITSGDEYTEPFERLAREGKSPAEAVFEITTADVGHALDLFRPIYESSNGFNGRVSIEVLPDLAYKTKETVEAAKRIAARINRPNLLVKIPATEPGLLAITEAIAEGISVNVTLIFGLGRYREVINAYMSGLEKALAAGKDLSKIHSVASFFVSRFDVLVDKKLEVIGSSEALALRGKAALANTRLAYEIYQESFVTERAKRLILAGANKQWPLWASTSTKNPSYSDTLYVTELVAREVVNTMPEKTLNATRDHGEIVGDTVRGTYAQSNQVLDELAQLGISYKAVAKELEEEGVEKFSQAWQELMDGVSTKFYRKDN